MATIPTPEQGKPILDFSAGTFDGNSNLIQSRNGATEHVNGDDVADYVNTSRIYNGLETTSKTPVGAINEVNREVDRGGVQLTQAQYDALVDAGTVDANTTYFITDGQNITTASAVSYDNTASGMTATNVQAAIDEIVFSTSETLTYNGVSFVFKKRGYFVEITCAHSTTKTFPTTWTSLTGTLPSSYFPSSDLYTFLGFPNGNSINIRLINGTTVQLRTDSNDSMYAQGSTIYMI